MLLRNPFFVFIVNVSVIIIVRVDGLVGRDLFHVLYIDVVVYQVKERLLGQAGPQDLGGRGRRGRKQQLLEVVIVVWYDVVKVRVVGDYGTSCKLGDYGTSYGYRGGRCGGCG